MSKILILDYGMGNLQSVAKAVDACGGRPFISSEPRDVEKAKRIILPGVGHFATAIQNLCLLNLIAPLNDAALNKKIPLMGICLGMQLMACSSEEAPGVNGMGWFNAKVVRFVLKDKIRYKVPHNNWGLLNIEKQNSLTAGIQETDEFYFAHAFYWQTKFEDQILARTCYESDFISVVGRENLYGVQFHPEKSYEAGLVVMHNFLKL